MSPWKIIGCTFAALMASWLTAAQVLACRTAADCNDNNVCTTDSCNGYSAGNPGGTPPVPETLGSCSNSNNSSSCGNASPSGDCDLGDVCKNGSCDPNPKSAGASCGSSASTDCSDPDQCNGAGVCDPKHKAANVSCGDTQATICSDPDKCDGSGVCDPKNKGNGTACGLQLESDCTHADQCKDGTCDPRDYNAGGGCDDGNACTNGSTCAGSTCAGGSQITCPSDGNVCTDDTVCDPLRGCTYPHQGGSCNDGDACTDGDHCQERQCVGGGEHSCSDGNNCTLDLCSPSSGCSNPAIGAGASCNDKDACTKEDKCDGGGGCKGTKIELDDKNDCTADTCDATEGPKHECQEGNSCSTSNACANKEPKCRKVSDTGCICQGQTMKIESFKVSEQSSNPMKIESTARITVKTDAKLDTKASKPRIYVNPTGTGAPGNTALVYNESTGFGTSNVSWDDDSKGFNLKLEKVQEMSSQTECDSMGVEISGLVLAECTKDCADFHCDDANECTKQECDVSGDPAGKTGKCKFEKQKDEKGANFKAELSFVDKALKPAGKWIAGKFGCSEPSCGIDAEFQRTKKCCANLSSKEKVEVTDWDASATFGCDWKLPTFVVPLGPLAFLNCGSPLGCSIFGKWRSIVGLAIEIVIGGSGALGAMSDKCKGKDWCPYAELEIYAHITGKLTIAINHNPPPTRSEWACAPLSKNGIPCCMCCGRNPNTASGAPSQACGNTCISGLKNCNLDDLGTATTGSTPVRALRECACDAKEPKILEITPAAISAKLSIKVNGDLCGNGICVQGTIGKVELKGKFEFLGLFSIGYSYELWGGIKIPSSPFCILSDAAPPG